MIETALDAAYHRLFTQQVIKTCPNDNTIKTYPYSYMGRLTEQSVCVGSAMDKKTLISIAKRAAGGSTADMLTIAMLYNVGFGLPKDEKACEDWSNFALVSPASVAFTDAVAELKAHVKSVPESFYPEDLHLPYTRIMTRLSSFRAYSGKSGGCDVFPLLSGIRVYLIYRQNDTGVPHLYAAYYANKSAGYSLAIDELIALGAPRKFGDHNGRSIIDRYRGTPSDLYIVAATITVPKASLVKAKLFGENTREVFAKFLENTEPVKELKDFDNSAVVARVAELTQQRKKLASAAKTVKTTDAKEYKRLKRQYVALGNELEGLQEKAAVDPKVEYDAYLESRPKSVLALVAQELYLWRDGDIEYPPLSVNELPKLLSTLGFRALYHPALENIGYFSKAEADANDLNELARIYEKNLGLKLQGLLLRPRNKANIRFCRTFTQRRV